MKISEVTDVGAIDSLLSVVETYVKDPEHLEAAKKQLLLELGEAQTNRHIYVARIDNTVVAMIQLVLQNADNDPELANGIDIAHVHNLQVRCEMQGRGIGRRMMEFVHDQARAMGKTTLTLGVDDGNDRALDLYKKLGYVVFKVGPGRTPGETCFDMRISL